jgi:8-oxo-dGTP pyrophosphatase MutT (NUDIX family)
MKMPWKDDGVRPSDDYSSIVLVRVFDDRSGRLVGYVFIIERRKKDPVWKLPGGHKERGEHPLETAVRETLEEAGLDIPAEKFSYQSSVWRKNQRHHGPVGRNHWSVLFTADITLTESTKTRRNHPRNEGEEPRYFTRTQFARLVRKGKFLPRHLKRLQEKGLWE